jgi:hypothetical protein
LIDLAARTAALIVAREVVQAEGGPFTAKLDRTLIGYPV